MIDLLHPDTAALLKKWEHVIAQTRHIHTWTTDAELSWLCEYVEGKAHYLEIGSHSGRSAKCVLLANPDIELLSIDTWDDVGSLETYQHNLRDELASGHAAQLRGPSQMHLRDGLKYTPEFDCCFIDGGHEDHLVVADIKGVIPLMKKGSLMAGHDLRSENGQPNDVARGVRSVLGDNFQNPIESIWVHQL